MNIPFIQASAIKNSVLTTGTLWVAGAAIGIGYMVFPASMFFPALGMIAIIAMGIVKPEYSFYLLIFVIVEEMVHYFLRFPPIFEVRLFPYHLMAVVTILGLFLNMPAKRATQKSHAIAPINAILLLTVIFEAVSLLWAPRFWIGAWLVLGLAINLSLYYLILKIVDTEKVLRRTVYVFMAAGIVSSLAVMLSQWIDVESTIYLTKQSGLKFAFQEQVSRPAGVAGVDHVAGFISICIFMTLGAISSEKRFKVKAFYFILILYMLYGIVLTTSRGVIIGLSGAYLFYITLHGYFKGKFIRYSFLFLIITIVIVLLAKPGFIDRMLIGFGYTGELLFSDASYSGTEASTEEGEGLSGMEIRKIWWVNGLHEMIVHPLKLLFGLGVGGFYYYSQGGSTVSSPEANSISFSFFYDLGIIGIVLFIFLVYILFVNLFRALKTNEKGFVYNMLLASTAALIAETGIHGLIDYDLTSYGAKFFWFPLGFSMAILNLVKAKINHDTVKGV